MKKTDTCYYMSITKEENSAFVVANAGTGTEAQQVVVETKTDDSNQQQQQQQQQATTSSTTPGTTTTITTAASLATQATTCTNGTTTTNISSAPPPPPAPPPPLQLSVIMTTDDMYDGPSESCRQDLYDTTADIGTFNRVDPDAIIPIPQVILQVPPSTPSPPPILQQHNLLLATDLLNRECCNCMRCIIIP